MRNLVILGMLLLARTVVAAAPSDSVLDAWFKGNALMVTASVPNDPDVERYSFELTPDADLRVRVESKEATGTLMVVSNVLLSEHLPVQAGYEIDAIDGPVLMMRLINNLLAFAAHDVPSSLHGRRTVGLFEPTTPIRVNTTSASAEYPAPWHLTGWIESVAPGAVTFQLTHAFTDSTQRELAIKYTGKWELRSPPPVLPDSISLRGWEVFELGPIKRTDSRGTILDYGAAPSALTYPTVGALRAAVRKRAK